MKLTNNKKGFIKNYLFTLLMIVMIMALPMLGNTQPAPGGGGGAGGNPDATTGGSVPIDGGLSLVLAAGVGYGAKKIRDYNKKKRERGSSESGVQ